MCKDKGINLEALDKDYNHAFAAMHFGKEFFDYDESLNADRASSPFQKSRDYFASVAKGMGYYSDYRGDSDSSDNSDDNDWDDAPSLDDVKGYLVRELILDLDDTYQIGYMPRNEMYFTLVNNWNSTKNGWRIVKDMYKVKGINLDALEKDYGHAFAAIHFGKEFWDYAKSSNADRVSSPFQKSLDYSSSVGNKMGYYSDYHDDSDSNDNSVDSDSSEDH
ncbi:hypothetical protein Q3G72_007494 [Acer saccharum]|nr:hypothetical protein Q3G72_007494 [Acer saccharum]